MQSAELSALADRQLHIRLRDGRSMAQCGRWQSATATTALVFYGHATRVP